MTISNLPYRLIQLDETDSTNDYASNLLRSERLPDFTTIRAIHQVRGKGQKGSSWESEAGKNLTFSILTHPDFLTIDRHFFLSIITSLAVTDFLKEEIPGACIKWPNDLYHGFQKIGGILIENSLGQLYFRDCVAGIGLNINQRNFYSDAPNPVSLFQLTRQEYSIDHILDAIVQHFMNRFQSLRAGAYDSLRVDYYSRLLGYQKEMMYEAEGRTFEAKITGIKDNGELILEESGKKARSFDFKAVRFIFPS